MVKSGKSEDRFPSSAELGLAPDCFVGAENCRTEQLK